MSNLLKNLLIALGLALILFVGYMLFVREGEDTGVDQANDVVFSAEARQKSQELLTTFNELKNYDTEARIFSDPLFLSLRDFRVDLGTELGGRDNPFAPAR